MVEELNKNEIDILSNITDIKNIKGCAHNIRLNGKLFSKYITDTIIIKAKEDLEGIDITVKSNSKNEKLFIPVIVTDDGMKDKVYNDFYIEEDADITIYAGCGIHNCSLKESEHSGIHRFYVGKNARVKYIENHFGKGTGGKNLHPVTEVYLEENSMMEMITTQISGVDDTIRTTSATLLKNSNFIVRENIKTEKDSYAKTIFNVKLNGDNSKCHVVSRGFATDDSKQIFESNLEGNCNSYAHSECDAITSGSAKVIASPNVISNSVDAILIHEATIGKIANDQLIKLMTLGLSSKEAENEIIKGFLK